MSLEVDPRVRDYDATLARSSLTVVEDLEMMSPREIREKQDETILRFGGTLEAKKVPKQATLDAHGKKIPTHMETYGLLQTGKTLEEIAEIR